MTSSNNMTCMRRLWPLIAAAALAGCSAGDSAGGDSAITGSDEFLELIEDARVAVRAGNLAEAGRYYDQAMALDRENAGLWVDIARLRFMGGEHLTAIEAADYALQIDPEYGPALLLRAQMVRDANGLAESLVWFEAAANADPRNPEVLSEYAATLGDLGRYKEMLKVVRDLAAFAPDYPQVHYLQAVLAARADDPVLAGALLARSGLAERGVPAAMMLEAMVNMQQGSYDTAATTLETLAERQPGNMRVKELLARTWWLGGRDRAIVDRFGAEAEDAQASPYLVMLVGRSLERMGERGRAIPFIERARNANRGESFVLSTGASLPEATNRLRAQVASGNVGAAQSFAANLLRDYPQSGDVHALAGDTALAGGNAARAIELYGVSAQVRRTWPLTRKLIAATRLVGDELAADALLSRYIAGDPHNTEALLLLAERSAEKEDWLRVVVLLDTAMQLGSGSDLEVLALRAEAARKLGREGQAAQFEALHAELRPRDFLGS